MKRGKRVTYFPFVPVSSGFHANFPERASSTIECPTGCPRKSPSHGESPLLSQFADFPRQFPRNFRERLLLRSRSREIPLGPAREAAFKLLASERAGARARPARDPGKKRITDARCDQSFSGGGERGREKAKEIAGQAVPRRRTAPPLEHLPLRYTLLEKLLRLLSLFLHLPFRL